MCNASTRASLQPNGSKWCTDAMDGTYTPYPCKEEYFEPIEWPHILSTLDVCINPKPLQFCTPEGYDIHPLFMLNFLHPRLEDHGVEPQLYCQDQVYIEELPLSTSNLPKKGDHVVILQCLHLACTLKEGQDLLKKKAQEES